jgi:plastocyanin
MQQRVYLLVALVACEAGGETPPPVDTPPPAPVVALSSCPSTVDATVMDSPSTFVPVMTSIAVGGVVKFTIDTEHYVIPHQTQPSDPALMVSRGETKCLRFNVAGTYSFACGVHGFAGRIQVGP